jgi:AcrR family transcriptional regulator
MSLGNNIRETRSSGLAKHSPEGLRTPTKRKRDRAAKQQALIQAALKLFACKGYESTTTREIAASAGCAEGLIHRYFKGKAGLLPALVEHRVSKDGTEASHGLQPASTLEDELVQLVDGEVERMWESRDFLRVFIPRAILDPNVASVMNRAVVSGRAAAIVERLKCHKSCGTLAKTELEALSQAVGTLGLVFGFMRPLILGQDRRRAKEMASALAKILVRSIEPTAAHQLS